ncbi:hypothetical protein ABIE13_005489, partial [Ottowia thiooxydans]
ECGLPVPHPSGQFFPGRIAALRLLPRIAPWLRGASCTTIRKKPARG